MNLEKLLKSKVMTFLFEIFPVLFPLCLLRDFFADQIRFCTNFFCLLNDSLEGIIQESILTTCFVKDVMEIKEISKVNMIQVIETVLVVVEFNTIYQHTIGFSWQPVLMVEEEPRKITGKKH